MSTTGTLLKEAECNAAMKPMSETKCMMPACPTEPPSTVTPPTTVVVFKALLLTEPSPMLPELLGDLEEDEENNSLHTRWRTGSWTEVCYVFQLTFYGLLCLSIHIMA